MRWIRTGWPPASTMETATAYPAFSARAVAVSIIFLAPASVRRLESVKYIRSLHYGNGRMPFPSIINRILQHSRGTSMKQAPGEHQYGELREGVGALCRQFDGAYWQKVDEARGYPEAFVEALTKAGWLSALIPEQYGGSGLSLCEASIIMEEINRSGGNSGACHGQMYNMGALLRHGSPAQKRQYLPLIATGELRLQSM